MSDMELWSDEPLKISELAKYLIKRYDLPKQAYSSLADERESENYGTKSYEQSLTRIIQKVKVRVDTTINDIPDSQQEKSLWDALKVDGEVRRISRRRFCELCFNDWVNYLLKNVGKESFNYAQLDKDIETIQKWERMSPEPGFCITDEELRERVMYMMLKALFEREFTPIDEKRLRKDIDYINFGSNIDNPTEEDKAIYEGIYVHPEGVYYRAVKKRAAKKHRTQRRRETCRRKRA